MLVVLLLIGGVSYFLVARNSNPESEAAFPPGEGASPTGQAATTVEVAPTSSAAAMGQVLSVTFGGSTLNVTVLDATWQPGSMWGQIWAPTEAGFLVLNMGLERVDPGTSTDVIPWSSWTYRSGAGGELVRAELIGGGYDHGLSSPNLAAGDNITGTLTFAVKSTEGSLILSDFGSVLGEWAIEAAPASVPQVAFDAPATSPVGRFPLEVTVQQPVWDANPDAVVGMMPKNGHWLYADYGATLVATAAAETAAVQAAIRYDSWRFNPDTGGDYQGELGEIYGVSTGVTSVEAALPGSGRFRIDAPAGAGTLALVGQDGTVIMQWAVAGPD